MITMEPIGYVHSPHKDTRDVPKGLGATHAAEGTIEIAPEFEPGLADIEGFSHLFVIWVFDRSAGCSLTSQPDWVDGGRAAWPRRDYPAGPRDRHARPDAGSGYQALPVEHRTGAVAARMAG